MNRRNWLRTATASMLAPVAARAENVNSEVVKERPDLMKTGSKLGSKTTFDDPAFFLSKANPVATADQRDMEALALKLLETSVVMQTKEQVVKRYKTISGSDVTAEAWARFGKVSAEEEPFNYMLKAVNSDANYPKVLGGMYLPPHEWFGMKVPGSRTGGLDGPDTNYAIAPVDPYARFELHGKRSQPETADGSYWLYADTAIAVTMNHLKRSDVKVGADGTYVITIGPEPANGRPNHIQTEPDVRYLYIRNNRSDWRQRPNAYRIKRLAPPLAAPLSVEQMAKRAANYMLSDVAQYVMWANYFKVLPLNTVVTDVTSTLGGMTTQRNVMARLQLQDDEAFVFTVSGGIPFRSVALFDYWLNTFDYWDHTVSFNLAQCANNSDGSTTFVVSLQDPGVHNWLDPVGYHEPRLFIRLQSPRWTAENMPWAKGEMVKLKDIERVLPPSMKRSSDQERKQQIAERSKTYALRFADS